jgi:endoglucanase
MRIFISAALFFGLAAAGASAAPLSLQRGVGLHEWLNWSPITADKKYVWPPYRSTADWLAGYRPASDWPGGDEFPRIRQMGFDFIRLSVDPGPLLASSGKKRQEALDILKADVAQVVASGLNVVFNLQAVSQVPAYSMDLVNAGSSSPGVARYRQMTADVARMLAGIGADKVAIEPFNEPAYYPCDAAGHGDWQKVMKAEVSAIRAVSPDLTIVATGACGGSITGLTDLDPSFDDPNILYSFHMYDPHTFTHQRLDDPKMFGSGLPWPPSASTPDAVISALKARMDAAGVDQAAEAANLEAVAPIVSQYFRDNWDEAALAERFGDALDWARSHNIPPERLFMGEFGAILMSEDGRMGAADADRLRYLTDVRTDAEQNGIIWSIWEYSNPFGMTVIVPSGPAEPDRELLGALGLAQ